MKTRASCLLLERRLGGRLRLPDHSEGAAISQEALGNYLGISKAHVSYLETGSRRPGRSVAAALEAIGGPAVADWERDAEAAA